MSSISLHESERAAVMAAALKLGWLAAAWPSVMSRVYSACVYKPRFIRLNRHETWRAHQHGRLSISESAARGSGESKAWAEKHDLMMLCPAWADNEGCGKEREHNRV